MGESRPKADQQLCGAEESEGFGDSQGAWMGSFWSNENALELTLGTAAQPCGHTKATDGTLQTGDLYGT